MGFLSDLTLGRYYPTGSVLHRLDPRVKMIGALVALVLVLLTQSPWSYLFVTATLVVLVLAARLRPGLLLRNAGSLKWLLLVALVSLLPSAYILLTTRPIRRRRSRSIPPAHRYRRTDAAAVYLKVD